MAEVQVVKLGCKSTATRRNKERAVWCGAIRSMRGNHDAMTCDVLAMGCDEMAASGGPGRSGVVWLRGTGDVGRGPAVSPVSPVSSWPRLK